jgi:flagellar biosynthesis protein FlhF
MDIKTYRAKTMQQALDLVRRELGADAAVLHTRELNRGPVRRLLMGQQFEVAASSAVNVPSQMPAIAAATQHASQHFTAAPIAVALPELDYAAKYRDDFRREVAGQIDELQTLVKKLCERSATSPQHELPEALFHVFTDMIEADVDESIARALIDQVRNDAGGHDLIDGLLIKARIAQSLEREIAVTGPIRTTPGERRLVALVGPTGVGKTTTIAKLAANFRLREQKRVGLITVDTYRVAAVEQLRTYADIIDLPMEVVATPREMREAVAQLSDLDLVLMDTAGRSPRDEVKIQELKSMLAEAQPDEVHLVLSSTAGAKALAATAERFAAVGTTALTLTKLDEATGAGHLIPLLRECNLPVAYLTDGQNVPNDIQVAQSRRLAYTMLGMEN